MALYCMKDNVAILAEEIHEVSCVKAKCISAAADLSLINNLASTHKLFTCDWLVKRALRFGFCIVYGESRRGGSRFRRFVFGSIDRRI